MLELDGLLQNFGKKTWTIEDSQLESHVKDAAFRVMLSLGVSAVSWGVKGPSAPFVILPPALMCFAHLVLSPPFIICAINLIPTHPPHYDH